MTCPSCSRELPGEFPFCPFCGAALTEAVPGRRREERKVVSVVFVDLVGFTARAERLDPEDVRALLVPYHAYVRTELERFGGTVEKFIGDAVMALFGAPVAHEDDPERAVRAALAVRDWAREGPDELQVRVAVNTGEALVALDARPSEGEAMAAGDVVNSASRLQAAAPLNGVLVGEQTYRATAGVFEYRAVEPVTAKGKSEPMQAWEPVAALSRFGVDVTRSTTTPLVGRSRELELLVSTLARVREETTPQLVTLVGVPGIGKSRLVHELFRSIEEDRPLVAWRQGRSLPYGDGVTFWALSEIVKAQAGILESDTSEQTAEKLERAVGRLAGDPAEARWLARQLRPLAGLQDDGAAGSSDESFAAWRRFLEALAEERPLVCVFEDLHWADDALLAFVDLLVERTSGVPLFVLATARPELLQRRPGWGGGKPNAATLSLSPLADDDAAQLVTALLDRPLLDAGLQAALIERAGGNPLYAEQYARVVNERGALAELPETVQGIITARLDGLPDEEKRLLQDAAVVGKVFWLGAVDAVGDHPRWQAEELLHHLERKEFVQRSRGSSVASESEYAFRHVLIRDVAYGQIPRAERARKHERTAGWIESLGRQDDQAELLAHHYLQALELAEAAGVDVTQLGDAARQALRDAGERAAALYAYEAAVRFFDAALRLSPEDGPERAELLFLRAAPNAGLGIAVGDPHELERAAAALEAAGAIARAAEAEALVSRSYWMQGDPEASRRHDERALRLIADAPAGRSTAWVLVSAASKASIAGDADRAIDLARRALALAEQVDFPGVEGTALQLLGLARVEAGDDGGFEDLARGIEILREIGALAQLSRVQNSLGVAHVVRGDLRASADARSEAARLAEQVGTAEDVRWFDGVLTEDHFRAGRWDEAVAFCDRFLAAVDAGSPHYLTGQLSAIRGELRLARGELAGALADAERALAHGRRIEDPQVLYYMLPMSAHLYACTAGADRARPVVDEFLDILATGTRLQFAVIALPTFAVAARLCGRESELLAALDGHLPTLWTEAVRAYSSGEYVAAADTLHRIGALPDEAEARVRAAERLVAEGRRAAADEQLRRAIAFYRSVGASAYLREAEALLALTA